MSDLTLDGTEIPEQPAPQWGPGDRVVHPMLGPATVSNVITTGPFPVYICHSDRTKLHFRSNAVFLRSA